MSGIPHVGGYRALLARPVVRRTVVLATVGRGGYAVQPLLLLFTVQQATGTFATAALTLSLYGLATFTMPFKARLIDRHGQRRVLLPLAAGLAPVLLLAALMGAASTSTATPWLLVGATCGLLAPPLGPSMRAQWRFFAPDDTAVAYALDAVVEEGLWLVGPLVAGLVLVVGPAWIGVAVAPFLVLTGALGLACSPAQGAAPTASGARRAGALRARGLWPVLLLMSAVGAAGALLLTGVAGRAAEAGRPGFAALGESVLSLGAVVGGLAWGRRQRNWPRSRSVPVLLGAWSLCVAATSLTGLSVPFLVLLLLAGACGSPLWVIAYLAADRAVEAPARTEASTWVSTAANLGASAGTALAGALSSGVAVTAPSWVAAALAAGVALVGALVRGDTAGSR